MSEVHKPARDNDGERDYRRPIPSDEVTLLELARNPGATIELTAEENAAMLKFVQELRQRAKQEDAE